MSKLAYSPMTRKVYLIKGNGQREDLTQHFMAFIDTVLPVSDEARQSVADALGLKLPETRTVA